MAVSAAAVLVPAGAVMAVAGDAETCQTKSLSDSHSRAMRLVRSVDGAKAPGWKFDAGRLQTKYSSSLTCTRLSGVDKSALDPAVYTYNATITVAASQAGSGAGYKIENQTDPVWVAFSQNLTTECVWSTGRIVVREKASDDVTAVYKSKKLATGDC